MDKSEYPLITRKHAQGWDGNRTDHASRQSDRVCAPTGTDNFRRVEAINDNGRFDLRQIAHSI